MATDAQIASAYQRTRQQQHRERREAERLEWLRRVKAAVYQAASAEPAILRVYLFGSIVQPGRFRPESDIDVAVECAEIDAESRFWHDLEHALRRNVDVRAMVEPIRSEVERYGEQIYEQQLTDFLVFLQEMES